MREKIGINKKMGQKVDIFNVINNSFLVCFFIRISIYGSIPLIIPLKEKMFIKILIFQYKLGKIFYSFIKQILSKKL